MIEHVLTDQNESQNDPNPRHDDIEILLFTSDLTDDPLIFSKRRCSISGFRSGAVSPETAGEEAQVSKGNGGKI